MNLLDRITHNPNVMGGKPCIRGMRITVGTITGVMASGCSEDELLQMYPYIKRDDVRAALTCATRLAQGVEIDLLAA